MDNSSNNRITVNVRLSSQIADTLGTNRVSVIVDESSTVTDVKEEIKTITLEISGFALSYFKSIRKGTSFTIPKDDTKSAGYVRPRATIIRYSPEKCD